MKQGERSIPIGAGGSSVILALVEELRTFIRKHDVSYADYHRALKFLTEAGAAGEFPLLLDVFLEVTVDGVN